MRSISHIVHDALTLRAFATKAGQDPECVPFELSPDEFDAILEAPQASKRHVISETHDRICGLPIKLARSRH